MALPAEVQQVVDYLKANPAEAAKVKEYVKAHPDDTKAAVKEIAAKKGWDLSKSSILPRFRQRSLVSSRQL